MEYKSPVYNVISVPVEIEANTYNPNAVARRR